MANTQRNLGAIKITAKFLTGILKATDCLPHDAQAVELVELSADEIALIVHHKTLPHLPEGVNIPEIELRPGEGKLKIKENLQADENSNVRTTITKGKKYPWEAN